MLYSPPTTRARQLRDLATLDRCDNDASPADHARGSRRAATQLALIAAAALAYFGVRGLTEGSESTAIANADRLLDVEGAFGIDIEASLQGHILDHDSIVTAANWVYTWGHWPVIVFTLVWLYRQHRDSYTLLRNAMFISGAIGLAIFISFPVAPPRLMPTGFVDTVTELSNSYRVLQPPSLINKYAAVPSLHVGWNLLVGILIFRTTRSRVAKLFALAGPAFMASAVVLTANHYIIDAVAGSLVALLGLTIAAIVRRAKLEPATSTDGRIQSGRLRQEPSPASGHHAGLGSTRPLPVATSQAPGLVVTAEGQARSE